MYLMNTVNIVIYQHTTYSSGFKSWKIVLQEMCSEMYNIKTVDLTCDSGFQAN